MKQILAILCLCVCSSMLSAQEPSVRATMFGLGRVRQLDTYLSPIEYSGPQLFFINENTRPTRLLHERVSFQSTVQLDFSSTEPASEKATFLGGNFDYAAAWHYRFFGTPYGTLPTDRSSRFSLAAGPQLSGLVGGLYNTRNGNNPAQAYLDVHLAASVQAGFIFRLRKMPVCLRDQLDVPLIGAMFTPAYGQSYYEIFSLGHYDHNVRAAHPFNAPSFRNKFTVDLPFRRSTLRVGYLVDVRQSHVNDLRRHAYSHAFVIGWVRSVSLLPPVRYSATDGHTR